MLVEPGSINEKRAVLENKQKLRQSKKYNPPIFMYGAKSIYILRHEHNFKKILSIIPDATQFLRNGDININRCYQHLSTYNTTLTIITTER